MSIRMRPDEDHEASSNTVLGPITSENIYEKKRCPDFISASSHVTIVTFLFLGSEFCADYQDSYGKWNQGFHCPSEDGSQDVYCCGTNSYKYCCTKREVLQPAEIPDLAIVLGVLCGTIFAITLITILSCFFCTCCLLYKRRHTNVNGGPLYQLHCSSTGSGVANMYSFSNQNSSATTPIDTNGPNPLVDLDYHQSATGGAVISGTPPTPPQRHPNSFATVDLIPTNVVTINCEDDDEEDERQRRRNEKPEKGIIHPDDAPPPYEATNPISVPIVISEEESTIKAPPNGESTEPQQGALPMNTHLTTGSPSSTVKSLHSSHTSVNSNQATTTPSSEETLYWSTKF